MKHATHKLTRYTLIAALISAFAAIVSAFCALYLALSNSL